MKMSIWYKIGLSLLIIGLLTLFVIGRFYNPQAKLGAAFSIYLIYILEWAIFGVLGLIIIILRQLRIIKEKEYFAYIFIGAANLANAVYGIYWLTKVFPQPAPLQYWALVGGTACLAFLIFVDVVLGL
jgi:hypothetical protein